MRALVVALFLVGMVSSSLAQTTTPTPVTINGIRTGWIRGHFSWVQHVLCSRANRVFFSSARRYHS
jgi:hypothetical protein